MLGSRYIAKPELKILREKMGRQDEMQGLINVEIGKTHHRSFYGNIENGARLATPKMALLIARILKSDVADIFKKTEEE